MAQYYRVSIPVEAVMQRENAESSVTHKLVDGIQLGDILRVRVENGMTFLDLEVIAEQRNEAITRALPRAERVVQLISWVYKKGFEVSLAGIQAIPLRPAEPPVEISQQEDGIHVVFHEQLYISDHFRVTEILTTLDELLPWWGRIEENSTATDGLEWLYLGTIVSNDRMAFLAYWIALELLIERTPGNERATTILQQSIPEDRRDAFLKDVEEVFKKYIEDTEDIKATTAQNRMMQQVRQAKATSDIDRWTDILEQSGVTLNPREIKLLRDARGAIVHTGDASVAGALSPRLRQIVTNYLNILLAPA